MKIIKLIAEDVKGLKAVEITPDGNLVEIAGENEAGKSSVLDAIWLVLAGRQASSEVEAPVRKGQEKGHATIDLGDIVATRTWTKAGSSLKVTSGDGKQVFSSPQSVLDALRAKFLDPGEFIAKDSKEQRQAILDLVDIGIDLDVMAAERKRLYDARTTVGQQGKAIGEVAEPDAGVPDTEVSASDLIARISRRNAIASVQADDIAGAQVLESDIAGAELHLAGLRSDLKDTLARVAQHVELESAEDLTDQLSKLDDTNRAVRVKADATAKAARRDELRAEYEGLTKKIDDLDKEKSDAIAKADLPVEGMDFTEDGITLDGVPFKDGSSSQKMVAALRIAASFNPQLRVIQVRDGSLLGKKNFQIVKDFAEENDYQIWLETVGEGHGSAILIEDGTVSA